MKISEVLDSIPVWVRSNFFYRAYMFGNGDSDEGLMRNQQREVARPDEANLITSLIAEQTSPAGKESYHKVMLDIDMPAELVQSSTPGHYHLYIDKTLRAESYKKLLEVLEECGIVQPGILSQFEQYGFTAFRLPHVKKGSPEDAGGFEKPKPDKDGGW